MHLQDVKSLLIGGGIDNVGGQIAAAVEIARPVGLPLAQRQRKVGALQQNPRPARCPIRGRQGERAAAHTDVGNAWR